MNMSCSLLFLWSKGSRLTMSWHVMKKAHSSEPEVSLLVLPFPYVPDLLSLFNSYVQDGLEVELVCRFFLLRVHFGQISSNQMLPTEIDELRSNTLFKV